MHVYLFLSGLAVAHSVNFFASNSMRSGGINEHACQTRFGCRSPRCVHNSERNGTHGADIPGTPIASHFVSLSPRIVRGIPARGSTDVSEETRGKYRCMVSRAVRLEDL